MKQDKNEGQAGEEELLEGSDVNGDNETSNNGSTDAHSEEIKALKGELEEQKNKYIRLFAEFDNFKRRTSKENLEMRLMAGQDVIISLLDVLDDMDRAEGPVLESDIDKNTKEGILLIFNKFRKTLESKGLKSIETLHSDFDVEKDEAISEVPVEDEEMKGKVVAEVQKGYTLNDKLIRFAKVVVGK
ncbi:MAG: nucleotide exchange factor GrpE [Ginsengibacter sp.]